jgi:hypothetical protein
MKSMCPRLHREETEYAAADRGIQHRATRGHRLGDCLAVCPAPDRILQHPVAAADIVIGSTR